MTETLEQVCKRLEHFETPQWAVDAILRREIMTKVVLDPCCGIGIMAEAAKKEGHEVVAMDVRFWGYPLDRYIDFLSIDDSFTLHSSCDSGFTVFMNPPFSLAEQFVKKAFELGARKVVCFQRFAWWESAKRRAFWDEFPPTKVYICGDRAACWRHDIPKAKRTSGTPTAHAFFIFEAGHKGATILDRIYKGDVA